MQRTNVANSGLVLSQLGLGTLTWGRDTGEYEAHDHLQLFVEAGGNWIEISNCYGDGAAESLLGDVLIARPEVEITVGLRTQSTNNSRQELRRSLESSLKRLRLSQVDLWLVSRFASGDPLSEVASVLDLAVNNGLADYVGLSNFSPWEVALIRSHMNNPDRLVAGEYEHSLVAREIESDLIPCLTELQMGVLAWAPLGRGVLTGKYRHSIPADSRAASPHLGSYARARMTDRDLAIVEAVAAAAQGLRISPVEIAMAWSAQCKAISARVTGSRTLGQLQTAIDALETSLPEQVLQALDEVSTLKTQYPDSTYTG